VPSLGEGREGREVHLEDQVGGLLNPQHAVAVAVDHVGLAALALLAEDLAGARIDEREGRAHRRAVDREHAGGEQLRGRHVLGEVGQLARLLGLAAVGVEVGVAVVVGDEHEGVAVDPALERGGPGARGLRVGAHAYARLA
jgi:hypothetical protein